jgi:Family of unknown function (DUF6221)
MTGRPSIVEFLRARLEEEEQLAQDSAAGPWVVTEIYNDVFCVADAAGSNVANECSDGWLDPGNARHIACWDPVRVLAEVEAKRRIIDYCESAIEAGKIPPLASWSDDAAGAEVCEHVLILMTLPNADHPDYDPAWAPQESTP